MHDAILKPSSEAQRRFWIISRTGEEILFSYEVKNNNNCHDVNIGHRYNVDMMVLIASAHECMARPWLLVAG